MKCPHCLVSFHSNSKWEGLDTDPAGWWRVAHEICPNTNCKKIIVHLHVANRTFLVHPKGVNRAPLPAEVDDENVIEDYNEASNVLVDSPKASAALSRRCLQHILREKAGVKPTDLNIEIQEVVDSGTLPSDISLNLDAIRTIGNFAAHPIKSKSSGEIVDVEPNEAEWNLEVLEQIIDFYYVRPSIAKKKRDELNKKLVDAGKPTLKS